MSRQTYKEALDAVLLPMGFDGFDHSPERNWIGKRERLWSRVRDGFKEDVFLQYSQYLGMTSNFAITDLETDRLYKEAMGILGAPGYFGEKSEQVGYAIGRPEEIWFKNTPSGPARMAEMVKEHADAWFDKVRTLPDQATKWYGRFVERRGFSPRGLIGLALTLYRMGEYEEAVAAASPPPRRTAPKSWVRDVDTIRVWLQARIEETKT